MDEDKRQQQELKLREEGKNPGMMMKMRRTMGEQGEWEQEENGNEEKAGGVMAERWGND